MKNTMLFLPTTFSTNIDKHNIPISDTNMKIIEDFVIYAAVKLAPERKINVFFPL